ncbi:MAG: hypothetical protein WCO47_09290 [Methylococcus sp.]
MLIKRKPSCNKVALQKELIDRDIELRYLEERIASLSALITSQTNKIGGLLAALLTTLVMTRYRRYYLDARVGAGLLPR